MRAAFLKADPNAKSGNPFHDKRSGKFGEGGGNGSKRGPETPPDTDPLDFARMLDAVREAARIFDAPDEAQIREFLQGRAANPAQVDINQFMTGVRAQQVSDIVDVLDQKLRGGARTSKFLCLVVGEKHPQRSG